MDDEGDIEQKLIEQQMEATRASLSNKLEALESQVAETVQTATDVVQNTKDAVAETVESVKDTVGEISEKVGDTARSVAHAFDLSAQVNEHPWLVFSGSIGVGCLVGWFLPTPSRSRKNTAPARFFNAAAAPAAAAYEAAATPAHPSQPSWVSKQVGRLRGLAIGMVLGTVRDLARASLPETISGRVAEEVDNLTPHLGGEVIHGQIIPDSFLHPEEKPVEPGNAPSETSASAKTSASERTAGRSYIGGRS